MIFVGTILPQNLFSQSAPLAGVVYSYSDYTTRKDFDAENERVISLATDVQQAIYLKNGNTEVYGAAPVCVYSNLESLSAPISHLPLSNVEMVLIKIGQLSEIKSPIDMSKMTQFPKLKYIYIRSDIEIDPAHLRQLAESNKQYIILYRSEKQS